MKNYRGFLFLLNIIFRECVNLISLHSYKRHICLQKVCSLLYIANKAVFTLPHTDNGLYGLPSLTTQVANQISQAGGRGVTECVCSTSSLELKKKKKKRGSNN